MKKIIVMLFLTLIISINSYAEYQEDVICELLPESNTEEAHEKIECFNGKINTLVNNLDHLESSYYGGSESSDYNYDDYSLSESPTPYEPVNYEAPETTSSEIPDLIEEIGHNQPEATSSPSEGPWGEGSGGGGQD
jgi:hypothetical protein